MNKSKNTKILIVTLSNLGDAILTLPVFQAIHRRYPGGSIDTVVGESARSVFQDDPRLRKIMVYSRRTPLKEKLNFLAGIRRERYDIIVDLRYSFIGLLGGAKKRNKYFALRGRKQHRALKHLSALSGLVEIDDLKTISLTVNPAANDLLALSGKPADTRWVAAAVGSKSDNKKWPAPYFARVLDRLALHHGYHIVLVGDSHDMQDARHVQSLMCAPVTDLTGKTSLQELYRVLAGVSLLITNDSAPLHIADGLNTPVLGIFGPTDERKYGPRGIHSQVARKKLFCAPCEKAQCAYGHECLEELSVDEVYQKAMQILNDEFCPRNLRILAIRLDRIGDVVLSLPALEQVKKRYPNCTLTVMTRPATQEILQGHPCVDEVLIYDYENKGKHRFLVGYWRFLRGIVERKFDAALILHPSTRSHLLPFLAGIPYRIGFDSVPPFLLTKRVRDERCEGLRHEADYTLEVVRGFDVPVTGDRVIRIPVFAEHERRLMRLFTDAFGQKEVPFVAVHPGASCPSKRWPVENFSALCKKIIDETSYRVVVVGGAETEALAKELVRPLGQRGLNLANQLSLKELAALCKRAAVLVSNDSGPVHVAAAVGTKTLTIFGRNQDGLSPTRWKALGSGHQWMQKDVGCVLCMAHRCPIEFECLKAVRVEELFEKLISMLSVGEKKVA